MNQQPDHFETTSHESARRADMVGPTEKEVRRLTPGQTTMLAIAMLVALIGAGMMIYTWMVPASAYGASTAGPDAYSSDPTGATTIAAQPSPIQIYAPAVFQVGFSFVIGFAIAYVFKTFVRITLVLLGVGIVAVVGMQVMGMLEINWAAFEAYAHRAMLYMHSQTGSFEVLATGMIPPAATGLVGILSGFKRN
jgi:uncharacterized membrane protein (Fun14 family)